jgi:hypothetical protein
MLHDKQAFIHVHARTHTHTHTPHTHTHTHTHTHSHTHTRTHTHTHAHVRTVRLTGTSKLSVGSTRVRPCLDGVTQNTHTQMSPRPQVVLFFAPSPQLTLHSGSDLENTRVKNQFHCRDVTPGGHWVPPGRRISSLRPTRATLPASSHRSSHLRGYLRIEVRGARRPFANTSLRRCCNLAITIHRALSCHMRPMDEPLTSCLLVLPHRLQLTSSCGEGTVPVSWAVDPLLADMWPALWNVYATSARSNDTFVTGTSCAQLTTFVLVSLSALSIFVLCFMYFATLVVVRAEQCQEFSRH